MTHLLMMPPLVCFSIPIYYPPDTQYPYITHQILNTHILPTRYSIRIYYPPDTQYPYITHQILNTHITHKTLNYVFHFLSQHLIIIFKDVPPQQVLKLVCICHPHEQPSHSAVLQKSSIFSNILEEVRSLPFCKLPGILQRTLEKS